MALRVCHGGAWLSRKRLKNSIESGKILKFLIFNIFYRLLLIKKSCTIIYEVLIQIAYFFQGTTCASEGTLMDIIKVSGTSRTSAVAGAIAGVFRENKYAEVQAIGAIAVNQAVKALALAKGYLKEDGYDVVFAPEFVDVEIEEKIRTAIKFVVELRNP
jgi:stage V sporulation protein S